MSQSKIGKLFLNKEIALDDLQKGIEFEMDYDEQYSDSDEDLYFDDENFKSFKEDVANMDDDHKPKLLSGTNIPFSELKGRMEIIEEGHIFKEILKPGTGIPIPNKSVVMIHYDAFLENQTEPFDSTRLRKRPYKFLLDDYKVILGLEIAVKTMKKDEISRFIFSPDYAYGHMGCPPRIPPSAEILYEIEILNFYDSKEAIEFEDLTPEDQKKAPFEKVISVYHCESKMANDLFHGKHYRQAIGRYRKTAQLLEDVSVANEEEDDKRNNCLLKLYLNLAQSYLCIQNPQKAIIYADLALRLDSENTKGLYRMGYAHFLLDEYEKAEEYFNKAKQNKPFDTAINKALAEVEQKRKQHLTYEKLFWSKALNTSTSSSAKTPQLQESEEFIKAVESQMKSFLDSNDSELVFSSGYTNTQIEVVEELAKKFELAFFTKIQNGNKIIKVVKKT